MYVHAQSNLLLCCCAEKRNKNKKWPKRKAIHFTTVHREREREKKTTRVYTLSGAALQTHNNNYAVVCVCVRAFFVRSGFRFHTSFQIVVSVSIGVIMRCCCCFSVFVSLFSDFHLFGLAFMAHSPYINFDSYNLFVYLFAFSKSVVAFEWAFALFFRFCGPLQNCVSNAN